MLDGHVFLIYSLFKMIFTGMGRETVLHSTSSIFLQRQRPSSEPTHSMPPSLYTDEKTGENWNQASQLVADGEQTPGLQPLPKIELNDENLSQKRCVSSQ